MAKLNDRQLDAIRVLLTCRAKREPLQYIMGEWPFHELTINVDKRALIPRPETEELAEILIKKFSTHKNAALDILELGTGSGALALTLAKYFLRSRVCASDCSRAALSLARENGARNMTRNVVFVESDWFSSIAGAFDLIVSNPPYLSEEEWAQTQPEIKFFEPKAALCAADGGKADLLKIIDQAPKFLKPNGVLALETGEAHHQATFEFAKERFQFSESLKDQSLRSRFLILSHPGGEFCNLIGCKGLQLLDGEAPLSQELAN
jgi:release factor glutamine methyltransferase